MTLIQRILKECGAEPAGGKRHRKYRLPNGRIFVMPGSHPRTDFRGSHNALAGLRRLLSEGMTQFPKPEGAKP